MKWMLVMTVVFALGGCSPDEREVHRQYGAGLNERRAELGVPRIGQDWEVTVLGPEYRFTNSARHTPGAWYNTAVHAIKSVIVDEHGTVVSEQDSYYGPDHFVSKAGDNARQKMYVYYFYDISQSRTGQRWEVLGMLGPDRDGLELSVREANVVLVEWGLPEIGPPRSTEEEKQP